MYLEAAVAAASFVVAALLTLLIRKLKLARGALDIPNERSSHNVPTPRGGGLAIVIVVSVAAGWLLAYGALDRDLFFALVGGGAAIAVVGWLDDRASLPPTVRLAVHFAAAFWALAWLGGLPPLQIGDHPVSLGGWGYVLGLLGIVWTLNLFNFMDGIDGIAASEAVFVALAGALIALYSGPSGAVVTIAVVFAAACLGFLLWNWPPAKIFMGDVGSGYLGYAIAVLALAAARENPVALLVWVILGATFFIDSTVTLVRRVARRERASEAHRSHAYQWLARRWGSHRAVTLAAIAINLLWLLPCALLAAAKPRFAGWMVLVALLPICIGALLAGAGRRESRPG
jgi:Fuc2NAc and GlcNAc transferase